MGNTLEYLNREVGLSYASLSWSTTVSSTALVSAPSSGKEIVLRYIIAMSSGLGPIRLTGGTTAATAVWQQAVGGPMAEEAKIHCGDATGLTLYAPAGTGNGNIRVYYSIGLVSGTAT